MKTYTSHSVEETAKVAQEWLTDIAGLAADLKNAGDQQTGEATLVGLSGHLGAGKTAFVKCVAKILGIKEDITSPTFVIMKIYELGESEQYPQWRRLVHIDAYRLESQEELEGIGFEKLLSDPHNLILMEWPENVGLDHFKKDAFIAFEILENNAHMIRVGRNEADFIGVQ